MQLKQKVLTYPAKESVYKKDDIVQINKVRSYVRKYDYLLYPFEETEHLSIDGKQVPHEDLVHFRSIATENVNKVIQARLSGDTTTLKPVCD